MKWLHMWYSFSFSATSARLLGPWQCNVECVCGSMKPNSTRSGSRGSGVRRGDFDGDFRMGWEDLSEEGWVIVGGDGPRLWFLIFHFGDDYLLETRISFWGLQIIARRCWGCWKSKPFLFFFTKILDAMKPCRSLVEAFLLLLSSLSFSSSSFAFIIQDSLRFPTVSIPAEQRLHPDLGSRVGATLLSEASAIPGVRNLSFGPFEKSWQSKGTTPSMPRFPPPKK